MKAAISILIGLVLSVSVGAESLIEGWVRLESGAPVADAQVRLFDMTDLERGAVGRAMTDGTGYFALPLAALGGHALPQRFALGPNYPNPFNPSTIIPYQLVALSEVRLEVFNLLGQRLATLVDGARPAGSHTATWHATDAAGRAVGAGVYIYRMTVGAESQTGRMVLVDGQAGVAAASGVASVWSGAAGAGLDGVGAQVYGLIVSGEGLVPYVDSSFRVEAGMAPVELVMSSGSYSAGKVTDDDCAFCDLLGAFDDAQEEEDETEEAAETDSTSSEGGPDLIVQSPSASAVVLTPGQAFTLQVTVENQGDEQAEATMLHYYRSNNTTISASDTEVGTGAVDALDASATSAESIELTASVGVEKYYGACVASVGGESNTDNNCSSAVKITVSEQEATEGEEEETPEEEEEDSPKALPDDALVTIPDANLRAAIEAELDKASGAPITVADMKGLRRLDGQGMGIRDLTGLEFATNLRNLWLYNNGITDISALGGLTNLRNLWLYNNGITDISALGGLTNLRNLWLYNNRITDISALSSLTNLTQLSLRGNFLSVSSVKDYILPLERRGVTVHFDQPVRAVGGFDIELVFLDDFTEGQKSVIQYAARRWMSIIREDLPDYTFTGSWVPCSTPSARHRTDRQPAGDRIDDLRIYVVRGDQEWGAPTVVRETSYLPVLGCISVRGDDLDTALHEMGHVLGIGTLWDDFFQEPHGDTHFNGPRAIAAFNNAGGRNYTGKKVPVDRDDNGHMAHWRSSVFRGELMDWTGAPGGGFGPLSAITVAALADLGYGVDVTQAEPYTLPRAAKASAKVVAQPTHAQPQWSCSAGQQREPIYVVDPQGNIVRTLHR